ncbi:hypothetical protein GN316_05235 [Xylophilus sp. Kf1]|nr:hypothetical protein [Xylophilus sp. Kf1]
MLVCASAMIAVLGFGFLLAGGRPGASAHLCRADHGGRALNKLSKLTPLPGSTILSRPEVASYSSEHAPNQFDGGVVSGKSLLVQARIVLDSKQGVLALSLDSSDCKLASDGASDGAVLTLEHLYGVVLEWGGHQVSP